MIHDLKGYYPTGLKKKMNVEVVRERAGMIS